jgi:hypothetical protein
MLTPVEFYDRLHEEPFRPLRVHVKDGRVYDIRYPYLNIVGVNYVIIGVPATDAGIAPFAEYSDKVPFSMIERVEELISESAPVPG